MLQVIVSDQTKTKISLP